MKITTRMLMVILLGFAVVRPLHAVKVSNGGPVVPGEWNSDWNACVDFAVENGTPILAVWGMTGCHFCSILDGVLEKEYFVNWAKEMGLVMAYVKSTTGWKGEVGWITGLGTKRQISGAPGVRIYWEKNGKVIADEIFVGRLSNFGGSTGEAVVSKIMSILGKWDGFSPVTYSGGFFKLQESGYHRLEAETSTTNVSFELIREPGVADVATNNIVDIVAPDGTVANTFTVNWDVGVTNQMVTVDISGVAFKKDGEKALLVVKDATGAGQDTNSITYVAAAPSVANPLWIGERTPSTLSWGEWTMDFDVAKAKTAGANGSAYTLAAVTGSLWCPDCANTERNFLGVETNGKNRFEEWAKAKQIALVTIDVPSFTGNTIESAKPTLLSRKAFSTSLARAKEYPASGADPSLTNAVLRSGLGYLTRKGASDEEATAVLERNRILVQTNTDQGGFHRPEDSNAYRTGVPLFVLLRKDGSVAGRLTRFAAVSPMSDAKAKWDDIIKRFDEMLELADRDGEHADDIENNHPGEGAMVFAANGGVAKGEISHVDVTDVFKLDGISGNALQKMTVNGSTDAEVKVSFVKLDTDGKATVIGKEVSGKLSDGLSIEETFVERGDYYLQVTCADITSGSFDVMSATAMNFHPFTVSGNVVLVPQQASATASAPSGLSEIVMRLEKGVIYRITGLAAENVALKALGDNLYEAVEDGDAALATAKAGGEAGGEVAYQKWEPGTYGFKSVSQMVSESAGKVDVVLTRVGGSSGAVTVEVMLNAEDTTLVDAFGVPRYEFETTTVTWEDGDVEPKTVEIQLKSNDTFDGTGVIALTTRLVSGWATVAEGRAEYRLTVTENTKRSPGCVSFSDPDATFARNATMYVKASAGATLYLDRSEATDGDVSVGVTVSAGSGVLGGDFSGGRVVWENRDGGRKTLRLTNLTAGKTQTVKIASPEGGVKIVSASNTVKVVAVRDDAPQFALSQEAEESLYRYIAFSNAYALASVEAGTKVTFSKLSGTLPAGLKVAYDSSANAMAIHGVPSAKAGRYETVYQVKAGSDAGLPKKIVFIVADPTGVSGSGQETVNPSVAKTRTFRDVPVIDYKARRLAGVIQLTIPQRGNVSAKYTCDSGTLSLSSKGWSGFDPETRSLSAELTGRGGIAAVVTCRTDGTVDISVSDPSAPESNLEAQVDQASLWGKNAPATAWKGYYTVALKVREASIVESTPSLAPRGYGYLTLKMLASSAVNGGKVAWAGMLPDGTSVSGTSVLAHGKDWAMLPIVRASSRDVFSVLAKIAANAVKENNTRAVLSADGVDSYWAHVGGTTETPADFAVEFDVYGGPYSSETDLASCCSEYYETTEPYLQLDLSKLAWTSYGVPVSGSVQTQVKVKASALEFSNKPTVPAGLTMKLALSTGVVSGNVKIPVGDGTISAKWKGVILQGWGEGCGCESRDENEVYLPFLVGSYYFTDKVQYEHDGRKNSFTVKRGGEVSMQ